jgi:hypothetical protein
MVTLGADLGHRVESVGEYVDDLAKLVVHDQVSCRSKADRQMVVDDSFESLAESWADDLAANFKVEVFASPRERTAFFAKYRPSSAPANMVNVSFSSDFEVPSELFYPVETPPSAEDDTPEAARSQLLLGLRRRRALFERLSELGFLDPMVAVNAVALNGKDLKTDLNQAVTVKRLTRTSSRAREL